MTSAFELEVTKSEIKSQEIRLEEIDTSIKVCEEKIAQMRTQKELINKMIGALKATLPVESAPILKELYSSSNQVSDQISKASTLAILDTHADGRGMQIKEIEAIYTKRGVDIVGRTVFRHVEALMQENKVLQVNPDAQRYRRYKAVQNTGGMPSFPSVINESE